MTETGTLTLAGFLLARIAEDEQTVRLVTNNGRINAVGGVVAESVGDVYSAHRLLAECEAKRRIIDEHAEAPGDGVDRELALQRIVRDGTVYQGGIVPACRRCVQMHADMDCWNEPYPCPTLRLLALPYADHPDFREEWRP